MLRGCLVCVICISISLNALIFKFNIMLIHTLNMCTTQGGILIFSYIHRLGSFFWVQNFEFQHFWGFSEKYLFGYIDFVDIFWGDHKIGLNLGIISMHFRVFSLDQGIE